jgi:hypothetical protein
MPRGLDGFGEEALTEAHYFDSRKVPVYAPLVRALARLAEDDEVVQSALLTAWADREFVAVYHRPLLALAAIRWDALADPAHPLARHLRAVDPDEGAIADDAIRASFAGGRPLHDALRARTVQTNEVTRAIAWRLPLAVWKDDVVLVDLGCSGGLNLVADRVEVTWTDQDDRPVPLVDSRLVVRRIGLDRAPIDPRDEDARAWLRACLWPGQRERHERLERAVDEASRALEAGEMQLEAMEALAMPERLEKLAREGPRILAYQTVFAEYLPPATRDAYLAAMRAFVARHPARAIWAELERASDGSPGVELCVHTHDGDRVLLSCDYHPARCALSRERITPAGRTTRL